MNIGPNQTDPSLPSEKSPSASPPPTRYRRYAPISLILIVLTGLVYFTVYRTTSPPAEQDHLRAAQDALQRRDFQSAVDHLIEYRAVNPSDTSSILLLAQTARRNGNYGQALQYLQMYEQLKPANPAAQLEAKLLQIQRGDFTQASAILQDALAHPDAPETQMALEGVIEPALNAQFPIWAQGRVDVPAPGFPAIDTIQKAIANWLELQASPADQVQGLVWRGRAYRVSDQDSRAVADFRKALEIDPEHFQARVLLAIARSQQSPEEAAGHFEHLRERRPDDPRILFALATLKHGLGQLREARAILERMLERDANDVSCLIQLGLIELDEERFHEAEQRLRRVFQINPDIPAANLALSRCLRGMGQTEEADRLQERFLELDPQMRKRLEAIDKKRQNQGKK
jgi:tetratricopeptide (TPR) repeat protein